MLTRDRASYAILCVLAGAVLGAAAPVPKSLKPRPPAELTADVLEGRWRADWGVFAGGWVEFNWNGTYTAKHDKDADGEVFGYWAVKDGWKLEMAEYPAGVKIDGDPACYVLHLRASGWPALDGTFGEEFYSQHGVPDAMPTPVRLSGRVRP